MPESFTPTWRIPNLRPAVSRNSLAAQSMRSRVRLVGNFSDIDLLTSEKSAYRTLTVTVPLTPTGIGAPLIV